MWYNKSSRPKGTCIFTFRDKTAHLAKKSSLTYHGFHLLQVGLETLFSGLKIRTTNTKCGRPGVPAIWSYLEPEKLLLYEKRKLKTATNADFSFNTDFGRKKIRRTMSCLLLVSERLPSNIFSPLFLLEATSYHIHFDQANFTSLTQAKA